MGLDDTLSYGEHDKAICFVLARTFAKLCPHLWSNRDPPKLRPTVWGIKSRNG
jgi:hypothetical protein